MFQIQSQEDKSLASNRSQAIQPLRNDRQKEVLDLISGTQAALFDIRTKLKALHSGAETIGDDLAEKINSFMSDVEGQGIDLVSNLQSVANTYSN
ncbi:MAG: hypothetical protein JKY34_05465 [Kordiimonadaceae bacterium]|nr:hypothetical protein [Kordiimonadaceae bacterium]